MELATRKFLLNEIKKDILENEKEIINALGKDLGKGEFEAVVAEVQYVLSEIDNILKKLHKWVKPKKVSTPLVHWPAKSFIHYEPFGNILVVAPWNYPFQLAVSPSVGAIAAGNTVVIKPSELASETEKVILNIFSKEKYSKYIEVVTGGVPETTELLNRRFDYIFYTGSTQVGKVIMSAAAKNLTPVTLELGGKSPAVVYSDSDLRVSARRIAWGKCMNAGQTCIAPDYVLVEKKVKKDFLKLIVEEIKKFYGENQIQSNDYGRIINRSHFERLSALLPNKVYFGGNKDEKSLKISPTIVEAQLNDDLMESEIFGPILPVLEFEKTSEVISIVKGKEKPLALYVFSKDEDNQNEILENLSYGGGVINDTLIHIANGNLPFGGVGSSGVGSYHGKHSFETFSHKKSIIRRSFRFDLALRYPPYLGKLRVIRWLLKYIG